MSRRARILSVAALAGVAVAGLVIGAAAPATAATGTTISVSTSAQLLAALKAVQPGDTISLADGTYSGTFVGTTSGTASAPITMTGGSGAILTNGDKSGAIGSGYGFHLEASYWKVTGFSIDNSNKGIVLDGANNDILDGLTVHHIGDEGIHLREFSSNDIVEHCKVYDTGTGTAGYGEGIYVGTSNGNWGTYTHGKPDLSNNDQILDNTVGPDVRADNLDVKEATVGGTISGNSFNAQGETGANYSNDV
ncbi:MAG TPA: right-handed parallel beta-helix repeat-containing protein, partial [Pseudonocardiaceae bacterium]